MRTSNYRKKTEIDKKTKRIIAGSAIGLVIIGIIFFFVYFHVDTVEVMGSSYYSEDEIRSMVLKGPLAKNSVLAPLLYSKEDTDDISFVEGVDVSQVNNHTIIISIEEIQPVGCIKYLDCYMYFDRQGIITASSVDRNMRVPFFEGMELGNVAYGDVIPFSDESILSTSVSLARIFAKNDEIPDHISFDEAGNITLTYGTVTAQLGPDRYLEDKMTRLIAILPKIAGQTGILHLENINDDKKIITFEKEGTGEEQTINQDGENSENPDAENDSDSSYDSSEQGDNSNDSEEQSDSGNDSGEENDSSSQEGGDSSSQEETDSSYDSDSGNDSSYDSDAERDSSYDSGVVQ